MLRYLDWLHTPHPFIYNKFSILLPGLVTFALIGIFAPFGLAEVALSARMLFAFSLGSVASLSVVFSVETMKRLFPKYRQEDRWTIGKELVLIFTVILVIFILICSIFLIFGLSDSSAKNLMIHTLLRTFLVSIFPVIILVLFEQYDEQRKQLKKAQALTQQLKEKGKGNAPSRGFTKEEGTVLFQTESGKPVIRLMYREIAFMKADGNYVEIFFYDSAGQISKKLVRNRIKNLMAPLPENHFFHCHKSYAVHEKWIHEVRGNARNYELKIKGYDEWIPVSRAKSTTLRSLFQN